jgi:hypothetical protein
MNNDRPDPSKYGKTVKGETTSQAKDRQKKFYSEQSAQADWDARYGKDEKTRSNAQNTRNQIASKLKENPEHRTFTTKADPLPNPEQDRLNTLGTGLDMTSTIAMMAAAGPEVGSLIKGLAGAGLHETAAAALREISGAIAKRGQGLVKGGAEAGQKVAQGVGQTAENFGGGFAKKAAPRVKEVAKHSAAPATVANKGMAEKASSPKTNDFIKQGAESMRNAPRRAGGFA